MTVRAEEVLMLNFLLEDKSAGKLPLQQFLGRALRALRVQLGVDTAFVSRFSDTHSAVVHVDSSRETPGVWAGQSEVLGDSCGYLILRGRLPELMRDTAETRPAESLPRDFTANVGAHVCVPIRLADGSIYGALTCLNRTAQESLNGRDVRIARVFAEMIAEQIDSESNVAATRERIVEAVEEVIADDGGSFLYQPIFDVARHEIRGFEALARFPGKPNRSPDQWFSDATAVGLDVALETSIVAKAFAGFASFPENVFIAFNVSPSMIVSGVLEAAFATVPLPRVVLEVNEHVTFRQYEEMAVALTPMRANGLRVSVAEAGGGLESLRHIVKLQPDIIKLDLALVREIDTDAASRALAAALILFAKEHGCEIIAEGIETVKQRDAVHALGVSNMQGYLLGRPCTLRRAELLFPFHSAAAAGAASAADADDVAAMGARDLQPV
jgi:EAL domain-containing protein (putative c-di-GMP-specific phosphodiesterase class I)